MLPMNEDIFQEHGELSYQELRVHIFHVRLLIISPLVVLLFVSHP